MRSLTELTLKGHFEELRKKYNKKGGSGKEFPEEVLHTLGKAIAMAEDFYERDPEFFSDQRRKEYQRMIKVINSYGNMYKGHPDLMGEDEDMLPGKMPMKKAGVKQQQEQKKRDAG